MAWRPSASWVVLRRRARLLAVTRAFFDARGLLEVETPALVQRAVTDPHLDNLGASDRGLQAIAVPGQDKRQHQRAEQAGEPERCHGRIFFRFLTELFAQESRPRNSLRRARR